MPTIGANREREHSPDTSAQNCPVSQPPHTARFPWEPAGTAVCESITGSCTVLAVLPHFSACLERSLSLSFQHWLTCPRLQFRCHTSKVDFLRGTVLLLFPVPCSWLSPHPFCISLSRCHMKGPCFFCLPGWQVPSSRGVDTALMFTVQSQNAGV